jgi:sulfur transfer complex TusBCD TusB component (DsrH family)
MLVIFESNAPCSGRAVEETLEAVRLSAPFAALVLVQDGVQLALAPATLCSELAEVGVRVLVDRFSLKLRGLAEDRLCSGGEIAEMAEIVDLLALDGVRAIWH